MRKVLELTGWVAELRAHGVKAEFMDASYVVSPEPKLYAGLVAAGEYSRASYFGWGITTEEDPWNPSPAFQDAPPSKELLAVKEASRAAAVDESVRHVERWMEQHAPIIGICGISDGALIAAVVAARSPSLQFFINFCSRPWEQLPRNMDLDLPESITVPSLH
eukprot:scaffold57665_cov60-Phaeocystis_antarctica.AAC.1